MDVGVTAWVGSVVNVGNGIVVFSGIGDGEGTRGLQLNNVMAYKKIHTEIFFIVP